MKKDKINESKTVAMTVYLTEEEASKVQKWREYTRSKSMSEFLRKALYMVGFLQLRLWPDNSDLQSLHDTLNVFYMCFSTTVGELLKCNEIEVDDVAVLTQKMDEICDTVNRYYKMMLTERHIQRNQAERYLIDRMDELLGISSKLS